MFSREASGSESSALPAGSALDSLPLASRLNGGGEFPRQLAICVVSE